MIIAVLVAVGVLALVLIVYGFLAEAHQSSYQPVSEPFGINLDELDDLLLDFPDAEYGTTLPPIQLDMVSVLGASFWLAFLIPLVDHLLSLQQSTTSFVVWAITIGPHEMGHFIFMPFGELIMFLGGSIFQVMFFVLIGLWGLVVRRQIGGALLMFMITGHSFLNMSVYIADAQERDLDLILGMDASHHDWWNILGRLGLLEHDDTIAMLARVLGVLIILTVIAVGVWVALTGRWINFRRYAKQEDITSSI